MEQPLIAIVDDDESVRDATERLMRSAGFSAETFSRGADFLSSPGLSRTACLVTDLNMPGMSGFDLHRRLQSLGRSIPTVLITGQPNENVRTQALSLGIICYLPKPFRDDDLIDSIKHPRWEPSARMGPAVAPRAVLCGGRSVMSVPCTLRTAFAPKTKSHRHGRWLFEIAPELTGHGLPLSKCEAYNRVYDQFYRSR